MTELSVRQFRQSLGQDECPAGDIFGRGKLVGTMAVAVATRDKHHASGGNAGREKRIVISTAYHFLEGQVVLVAGANQGVRNDGRTSGGCVGIYNLELDGDATFLRHTVRFILNSL